MYFLLIFSRYLHLYLYIYILLFISTSFPFTFFVFFKQIDRVVGEDRNLSFRAMKKLFFRVMLLILGSDPWYICQTSPPDVLGNMNQRLENFFKIMSFITLRNQVRYFFAFLRQYRNVTMQLLLSPLSLRSYFLIVIKFCESRAFLFCLSISIYLCISISLYLYLCIYLSMKNFEFGDTSFYRGPWVFYWLCYGDSF